MARILPILLTVGALLVCPFNCLGHAAARCAQIGAKQDTGCHCCRHHGRTADADREQGEKSPAAPREEGGCSDCLCRGAVLADDDLTLSVDVAAFGPVLFAPPVMAADLTPVSGGAADESPPPGISSGRQLRFALQSLLI